MVPGDAAATVESLVASGTLYRLGIVGSLAMYTVFIVYVLILRKLLEAVDEHLTALMVALALVGAAVAMLNSVSRAAPLLLLDGAGSGAAFPAEQLEAHVAFFLGLHRQGNLVAVVFWGLWLLPLGRLVYRSGFFPRVLGVLLMIGCFGWLILFVQRFLLPDHGWLANARYAANVAELAWMVWLLARGVDREAWEERAAAPG